MLKPAAFITLLLFSCLAQNTSANEAQPKAQNCPATLDFTLRQLNSETKVNLCETYRDNMVLIVNTASHCGFTPQFTGLEKIYKQYKARGFVVLGMPSNDCLLYTSPSPRDS